MRDKIKCILNYVIRRAILSDAEGIAFVHANSWQTSYAGLIDPDFLESISYEKRLASWQEILKSKNTLHLVAGVDGKIVGFADVGPARPESYEGDAPLFKDKKVRIGEVYAIYLLEQHKRIGLGRALFKRARAWLLQQNMKCFIVWVLADNLRAKHFYKNEGGKSFAKRIIPINDQSYPETCYLFTTQTP
jgi:GNAT superfamily N-acetyltransferase